MIFSILILTLFIQLPNFISSAFNYVSTKYSSLETVLTTNTFKFKFKFSAPYETAIFIYLATNYPTTTNRSLQIHNKALLANFAFYFNSKLHTKLKLKTNIYFLKLQ